MVISPSLALNVLRPSPYDSKFKFNPKAKGGGRYTDQHGNFVSSKVVLNQLEKVINGTKAEMTGLYNQLEAGEIGIQEWYDGMRRRMKIIHGISASIAKGGWAQMTQSDWGKTGNRLKKEYRLLSGFAQDMVSGKQPLNGNARRRAGMYAEAARGTGEETKRGEMEARGATHERRMLGATENHCHTDKSGLLGCVELADKGWQLIGEVLPPIGTSPCRTSCLCRFIYGRMENGRVVPL